MRRIISIVITIAVLLSTISSGYAKENNPSNEQKPQIEKQVKTTNLLVKYKEGKSGIEEKQKNKKIKSYKKLSKKNTYNVEVEDELIDELKQDKNIEFVEENGIVEKKGDVIPWNIEKINITELHKSNYYGNSIKVAVFDTGIDTENTDLKVTGGVSFVDGVSSYDDDNGHGTAMAGVISALKNDQGLLGIAPEVELYSVKVLDQNGVGTYGGIIDGIQWAIDNDIDIISMSLGGTKYSKLLEEEIDEAYNNNILLIASSGNEGNENTVNYPAKYLKVICVGAVDKNNEIASFSNTGKEMDLVAPGVGIETTGLENNIITTEGTSVAAAHVTGVAAAVWSKDKGLSNLQIDTLLCKSAVQIGNSNTYGYGLVNAGNALKNFDTGIKSPDINKKIKLKNKKNKKNKSNGKNNNTDSEENYKVAANTLRPLNQYDSYDPYEPNDDLAFSTKLNSCNVTVQEACISCYEDLDFYEVYFPIKGRLEINLSNLPADCDMVLYYKAPGSAASSPNFITSSRKASYNDESIVVDNAEAGTYTIIIYATINNNTPLKSPTQPYKLVIGTGVNVVVGDSYEPNDTFDKAANLKSCNVGVNALISSSNDVDWYYFSTPGEGTIDISLTYLPADYELYLFDSSTGNITSLASSNNSGLMDEKISYKAPSAGSYHVFVDGYQRSYQPLAFYRLEVTFKTLEDLHYGELGVQPATGNYSCSHTDMSSSTPIFDMSMTRTYNSRDNRQQRLLGRGWTFSFEGSAKGYGYKTVKLPDGSGYSFFKNYDGSYLALDSRYKLEELGDGSLVLTTKKQYKYGFNVNGWLTYIKDRNDNTITIEVANDGKVTGIKDAADKHYTIAYNAEGLIFTITEDLTGRKVTYGYINKLLTSASDPMGGKLTYSYYPAGDSREGYLREIKENSNYVINTFDYNVDGADKYKVKTVTDENGNSYTYTYDNSNSKTTITDKNGRVNINWYDSSKFITTTQDAENKNTTVEYSTENNENKFGESKYATDRNGNKTEYVRDSVGNVTKIINPDQSYKEFKYDTSNNVIEQKDEENIYLFYIYDIEKKNLLKQVRPLNGTDIYVDGQSDNSKFAITQYIYYTEAERLQNGYKVKGLLKAVIDPNLNVTTYTYDTNGNIHTATDGQSNTSTSEYYNTGLIKAAITPKGYKTEFTYDLNGRLEKTVYDGRDMTRITYDAMGRKTKEVAPKQYTASLDNLTAHTYSGNHGTRYTYYSSGKVWTVTDAENNTTTYNEYDLYGNLKKETRANGAIFEYDYDIMNRISKVYFTDKGKPKKLLEEYSYPILADGKTQKVQKTYETSAKAIITTYTYNYAGKLLEQLNNNNGTKITNEYYKNGEVKNVTDPKLSKTEYTYDQIEGTNRYDIVKTPFEEINGVKYYTVSKNYYDKNGNVIKSTVTSNKPGEAEKLKETGYEYDKTNKLVKVTTYNNGAVENIFQYYYDADGNKVRMYQGLTSPLIINGLDSVVPTGDSIYTITKYEYDRNNRLSKMIDPTGKEEVYDSYDPNGNLTHKKDRNNSSITMTYDNLNRIKTNTVATVDGKGNVSTTYNYDDINRKVTITNDGETTTLDYDGKGRLLKETVPGSITKQYTYNDNGTRATFISQQGATIINNSAYEYDSMGRLLKVKESGQQVANYEYDQNGNRNSMTYGNNVTVSYTYNLANKVKTLVNKNSAGAVLSQFNYTYYLDANEATKTDAQGQTTYAYDGLGRIENTQEPGNVTRIYTYDDRNNRSGVVTNGPLYENPVNMNYEYDGLDRLTKTIGLQSSTYKYNADGLRQSKTVDGVTTTHVLDGTDVAADIAGTDKTKYVRGINLICMEKNGQRYYYLFDAHGNVVQMVDANGNIVNNYTYDEWGNIQSQTEGVENPFKYCGEYWDKETGNIYLRARYYDPTIGRFITEDSVWGNDSDPLSLNLYTYCGNNPIMFFDPSGHITQQDTDKYNNGKINFYQYQTIVSIGEKYRLIDEKENLDAKAKAQAKEVIHQVAENFRNNGYHWEGGDNLVKGDRLPDFWSLTVSAGVLVGGTATITWDVYGREYDGIGLNVGKSLTPISASFTANWILQDNQPDPNTLEGYCAGWGINVGGGYGLGGGFTKVPGQAKSVLGVGGYTPQAGASAVYSWKVYDPKDPKPKVNPLDRGLIWFTNPSYDPDLE